MGILGSGLAWAFLGSPEMLVNIYGSNRSLLRFTPVGGKRPEKMQKRLQAVIVLVTQVI